MIDYGAQEGRMETFKSGGLVFCFWRTGGLLEAPLVSGIHTFLSQLTLEVRRGFKCLQVKAMKRGKLNTRV